MAMIMPSHQVQEFAVTVPAGTPVAAPVLVSVAMPNRVVNGIIVDVPPGALGLVGWRITDKGGNPVVPVNGTFVVTHARTREYALKDQPDSGDWAVQAYNTGTSPHTVKMTFLVDILGKLPRPRTPAYIPDTDLSSAPDLSQAGPPVRERDRAAMADFRRMTAYWAALAAQRGAQGR